MLVKTVAFWTPNYADEIQGLKATASEFGIHVYDTAIRDMDWRSAVLWKPWFILENLLSLGAEYDGLLYTDADSRIRREIDFDRFEQFDFAAHWFTRSKHHRTELLTGTMYFSKSEVAREFVSAWATHTAAFSGSDTPEQDAITTIFPSWKNKLQWVDFGPELVWIFDDFVPIYPGQTPIIEHLQASRKQRRK